MAVGGVPVPGAAVFGPGGLGGVPHVPADDLGVGRDR